MHGLLRVSSQRAISDVRPFRPPWLQQLLLQPEHSLQKCHSRKQQHVLPSIHPTRPRARRRHRRQLQACRRPAGSRPGPTINPRVPFSTATTWHSSDHPPTSRLSHPAISPNDTSLSLVSSARVRPSPAWLSQSPSEHVYHEARARLRARRHHRCQLRARKHLSNTPAPLVCVPPRHGSRNLPVSTCVTKRVLREDRVLLHVCGRRWAVVGRAVSLVYPRT